MSATTPGAHPLDHYRPWAKALLTMVVATVVGLVLAHLSNGVPAAEAAKRMAARAYMPLLTSTYPATGREQITVLTIDDLDLAHLGLPWPLPMDFYQRQIDRLVAMKPRAIFIDLLFLDDRPPALVARFAQAACAAGEAGVPVYLASLQGQRPNSATMTQLQAATRAGGEPCVRLVAPNLIVDGIDRSSWDYPLQVPGVASVSDTPRSVAVALACDLSPKDCPRDLASPMAVLWPAQGHALNEQLQLQADAGGTLAPACRSDLHWAEHLPLLPLVLRDWLRGGPRPALCAYHRELPLRGLSGVGLSVAERQTAIEHKIVLLGTAFQSQGDRIHSPLGQDLPAVHAHAMALDNLLSLGGQYRRSGDFDPLDLATPASLFTLVAVGLTALGGALWHLLPWHEPMAGPAKPRAPLQPSHGQPSPDLRGSGRWPRRLTLRRPSWRASHHPWRWLLFVPRLIVLTVLRLISLGRWPDVRPAGSPGWGQILGRALASVLVAVVGIGLLFMLGDRVFRVGPLSVIEYVLFPLGVDFLDRGRVLTRHAASLLQASLAAHPVALLRQHLLTPPRD